MKPITRNRFLYAVLFLILSFLLFANYSFAETKTFIKEYTYQASDEDSKNSSRTIALREVKRLLLEELGTYLESQTEVKNFQLTKDQITTLTAGIVQTELVEEKWNTENLKYWLKAKIVADSSQVIKSIDALRKDRQKTKELEELRKKSEELLKENARIRRELLNVKGEKRQKEITAYNKTIKELSEYEWTEKALASVASGNYNDTIAAYNKVIEIHPNAAAYNHRGLAYYNLGNFSQALNDYDKAINLFPKSADIYFNRGNTYASIGNYSKALNDYDKAIGLGPRRDLIAELAGVFPASLEMYYNNRGVVYYNMGDYKKAINDFDMAIKLNHKLAEAYFGRGGAYALLGNYKQAIADNKIAAKLGHKEAQDFLEKNGINW